MERKEKGMEFRAVFGGGIQGVQKGIARDRHALPSYALRSAGGRTPAGLTAARRVAAQRANLVHKFFDAL